MAACKKWEKTIVSVTMPKAKTDEEDDSFQKGNTIWSIYAYRMEKEFDHHSRVRKGIKIPSS